MQRRVIVLLGPPGSGKGTQAARLSSELAIPAVSTGEILRRESASGSALGRLVQRVLASGQLVSDKVMGRVVASRICAPDCEPGFILDGYPRTVSQARQLERLLESSGFPEPVVFDFQISNAQILSRLGGRLECPVCGGIFSFHIENGRRMRCNRDGSALVRRADDNAASIQERIRLYSANATKLARYYASKNYFSVNAERSVDIISAEVIRNARAFVARPRGSRPSRNRVPARLSAAV